MRYENGDLLASGSDVIAHCCNCENIMGAGVAKAIRLKYPRAYKADLDWQAEPEDRLGKFTKSKGTPTIYNLYGQLTTANEIMKVAIDYDALRSALKLMTTDLKANNFKGTIGLPRLGAGLAGGKWEIIESILNEELAEFNVTVWSL